MKKLKSIKQADLAERRVLLRVDFNVPLKDGVLTDTQRIDKSLETINYIIENSGIPVIVSHLGRPKGERNEKYSLLPVKKELEKKLNLPVTFISDFRSNSARKKLKEAIVGDVILLENIRFYKGEEKNDPSFAEDLAKLCDDIYVDDAFGCSHRNHASTEGVCHYVDECYAGFLVKEEIEALSSLRKSKIHPYVAIIGGAKVSTKITVLESFLSVADKIIIAGGMAYTFFKALGIATGKSLVEDDYVEVANSFLERAKDLKKTVILPIDHVCAKEFADGGPIYVDSKEIPDDLMAMDIGVKTIKKIKDAIKDSKMLFWNGPVGVFEFNSFNKGTFEVAKAVANLPGCRTVVGGGDSVSAINKSGYADDIWHVSTGGGASLEFLEGRYFDTLTYLYSREYRRKLLYLNWKMNKTANEAKDFIDRIQGKINAQDVELLIAPTFPILPLLKNEVKGKQIAIAAQNLSQFESGAYTGEVSAKILKSVGAESVIIGHNERKILFNESCRLVNAKVKRALAEGLKVILCIGESAEVREEGEFMEYLWRMLCLSLSSVSYHDIRDNITIAYEPIWAIGGKVPAKSLDAKDVAYYIRGRLAEKFDEELADNIRILYGGSVSENNIGEFLDDDRLDGVLVGSAGLDPDKVVKMAEIIEKLSKTQR